MSDYRPKTFYLTTTLPYVNADPHIGFALEIVQADIIARYKKLQGFDVFFNTGTDEHGLKIYRKAQEEGVSVKEYVDVYAEKFKGLKKALGLLDSIHFIRTTDASHVASAQHFWRLCDQNGYIYKKSYSVKYCVGCELEKTDSELVDGRCPIHPNLTLELIEEENYFFKFSAFQKALLDLYENKERPHFVVPESRLNEIKAFVGRGLEDFSISRLASKMPWGVPVPGDDSQVMYVWFDALVNYISTIGWPHDMKLFETYWPALQFAGKDNLRQQSAMWQAMLMAAGLEPSLQIMIHGFISHNGQKMSKSLGNVVNPYDVVAQYGTDALRYFIALELHPFEDSDYNAEKYKEFFNAKLANGIGNLTSRIMKMASTHLSAPVHVGTTSLPDDFCSALDNFEFQKATKIIDNKITALDKHIQTTEPFKVIKHEPERGRDIITKLVKELHIIACMLEIIIPDTAHKIQSAISSNVALEEGLFMRIE